MIGRLIHNPLLVAGGAVVLVVAFKMYFMSQEIELLDARLASTEAQLQVCNSGSAMLTNSIKVANEAVTRLENIAETRRMAYENMKRRLEEEEQQYRESLGALKAEAGESCEEGIALIDRELGL